MVKKLQILVLGERNMPLEAVTVPAALLADLDGLLAAVREKTPEATYETVLRAVLLYGGRSVTHSLKSGLKVNADGIIPPPVAEKLSPKAQAARNAEILRKQQRGEIGR